MDRRRRASSMRATRRGSQARSAADLKISPAAGRLGAALGLHFATALEIGHFLFQIVYSFLGLQPRTTSSGPHNAHAERGELPGYSDNLAQARARKRHEHNAQEKEKRVEARSIHRAFPSCDWPGQCEQPKPCAATPAAGVMAITSSSFPPAVSPAGTWVMGIETGR